MAYNVDMPANLDLSLEELDALEAPMSDFEAGVLVGLSLGAGLIVGALIAT